MSEVGAPTEPRPVFETSCKPDIVARLRADSILPPTAGEVFAWPKALLVEAAEAIEGLRESDARRLRLINAAKAERDEARARVAELEAGLRAIRKAVSDRVDQFDRGANVLAGDPMTAESHMRMVARTEAAERICADISLIVIERQLLPPPTAAPATDSGEDAAR